MPDPLNRKPWPMKWVVLAIIACVIPYTWITVHYRKPDPAYQPYEDSKQRANVLRLLDAGYRRMHIPAEQTDASQPVVTGTNAPAVITDAPGGLPESLAVTLVETPPLALSFGLVSAARETTADLPYPVAFTCELDNEERQIGGAHVFLRGETIVIVPQSEPHTDELPAHPNESAVVINIPGGSLKPGRHTVLLVGSAQSRQWTLEVR